LHNTNARARRRDSEIIHDGRAVIYGGGAVVVLDHIDDHDTREGAVSVDGVCRLCVFGQGEVLHLDLVDGEVAERSGDRDVAIVRWLGAFGRGGSVNGLPRCVAVVSALVHMHALDARRRAVKVEVDTPERGAESVGEARCAFIVQGVGLA